MMNKRSWCKQIKAFYALYFLWPCWVGCTFFEDIVHFRERKRRHKSYLQFCKVVCLVDNVLDTTPSLTHTPISPPDRYWITYEDQVFQIGPPSFIHPSMMGLVGIQKRQKNLNLSEILMYLDLENYWSPSLSASSGSSSSTNRPVCQWPWLWKERNRNDDDDDGGLMSDRNIVCMEWWRWLWWW